MSKSVSISDSQRKYFIPAFERKPKSITALNVSKFTSYADTLLIIEGSSNRQVTSIAEHIIKQLKAQKVKVIGMEGVKQGEWALLDYGDVIIHVFESRVKELYDLEGFWADAPVIDLSEFGRITDPEDEDDI